MIEWVVYPILLLASHIPCFVNVLGMPTLIALWIYDKSMFIEWTDEETGQNWPKEGLPTAIAREFMIMGLLWQEYTYFEDHSYLHISLARMIVLWWMSMLITMQIISLPIIIPWAMMSVYQLSILILYEVLVL